MSATERVAAFGSRSTISGWAAISPSRKSSRYAHHRVHRRLDYPASLGLDPRRRPDLPGKRGHWHHGDLTHPLHRHEPRQRCPAVQRSCGRGVQSIRILSGGTAATFHRVLGAQEHRDPESTPPPGDRVTSGFRGWRPLFIAIVLLAFTGCGMHYWQAADRGVTEFGSDSGLCIEEAKSKYEVSERIYRRCMRAHGW